MIPQRKQRIEQIQRGEVPEGYKKTKVGVVPNEWEETRFKKMFSRLSRKNKENNDKYIIQNIDTEKYYHTYFTKIRKNNTCMVEKDWQYIKIHKGINIDIFPLFPYPDNEKDRKKILLFVLFFLPIYSFVYLYPKAYFSKQS